MMGLFSSGIMVFSWIRSSLVVVAVLAGMSLLTWVMLTAQSAGAAKSESKRSKEAIQRLVDEGKKTSKLAEQRMDQINRLRDLELKNNQNNSKRYQELESKLAKLKNTVIYVPDGCNCDEMPKELVDLIKGD